MTVASLRKRPQPLNRWIFLNTLAALLLLGWVILLPKGFPVDHLRFWSNGVIPIAGMLFCSANIYYCIKEKSDAVRVLVFLPGLSTGLVVGCLLFYWQSMCSIRVLLVVFPWAYLMTAWWILFKGNTDKSWRSSGFMFFAVGIFWAFTQQAPQASTNPHVAAEMPEFSFALESAVDHPDGLTFVAGGSTLQLNPYLTFDLLSPDGFWTLFTPDDTPPADMAYALESTNGESYTAWTHLVGPTASHLSSFSELFLSGEHDWFVEFSPCKGQRFAILPSDYPTGRPARAAYYDASGQFNVVEGSSGEKGPFNVLASGPHGREETIELSFYAGEELIYRVGFEDFTSQCSTALSPTAGWGFPQNAIEFGTIGEDRTTAFIVLNLASTSVGRGWDTVRHAPGMYRNRFRVVVQD